MRQMSKRRLKLFRMEVEASLEKYCSSTDTEDDDFTPPPTKKPCTVTTTATFSSSSSIASSSYGGSSSFYPSEMQQPGGDSWQPLSSRWISNLPQAASTGHSQDSRYTQQYLEQQRMRAFQMQLASQMQPTSQQFPHQPPLRHISYGQPAEVQEDFSRGCVRPQFTVLVTSVTNSPVTQALGSSGIDASTLQDNSTQENVNMPLMSRNLNVFDQEGVIMDSSSLGGVTRPLSAPVLPLASDASPSSRAPTPRSQ